MQQDPTSKASKPASKQVWSLHKMLTKSLLKEMEESKLTLEFHASVTGKLYARQIWMQEERAE